MIRMKKVVNKSNFIFMILLIYFTCLIFRIIEYFFIQTDKTFIGEAVIHKFLGILVLFLFMKIYNIKNIGFCENKKIRNILKGFGIGIFSFLCAYFIEILIFIKQTNFLGIKVYVSSYSPNGNFGEQTSLFIFLICILGNIINVVMEEGVFRGLFQDLLEKKYSFLISAIIASFLFGLWHIVAPTRLLYGGEIALMNFIISSLFLIISSALVGFNFALMTRLSRGLYMAMACHFLNNTIVNIVHIVSKTGTDEFLVFRVGIAQAISFIIILLWYFIKKHKKKTKVSI